MPSDPVIQEEEEEEEDFRLRMKPIIQVKKGNITLKEAALFYGIIENGASQTVSPSTTSEFSMNFW